MGESFTGLSGCPFHANGNQNTLGDSLPVDHTVGKVQRDVATYLYETDGALKVHLWEVYDTPKDVALARLLASKKECAIEECDGKFTVTSGENNSFCETYTTSEWGVFRKKGQRFLYAHMTEVMIQIFSDAVIYNEMMGATRGELEHFQQTDGDVLEGAKNSMAGIAHHLCTSLQESDLTLDLTPIKEAKFFLANGRYDDIGGASAECGRSGVDIEIKVMTSGMFVIQRLVPATLQFIEKHSPNKEPNNKKVLAQRLLMKMLARGLVVSFCRSSSQLKSVEPWGLTVEGEGAEACYKVGHDSDEFESTKAMLLSDDSVGCPFGRLTDMWKKVTRDYLNLLCEVKYGLEHP